MKSIGATLALVFAVTFSVIVTTLPVEAVKDESLVLYLSLDEGSGNEAGDLSANLNAGELMGEPTWMLDGKHGKAMTFDGADDHIVVPDRGFTDLGKGGDGYTVEFWIKTAQQASTPDWWTVPAIMAKRGLASKVRAFTFYLTMDDTIGLHFEAPQEEVVSISVINDDEWHHVAATRDGADAKLYVDGNLETSAQITDNDKSSPGESVIIGGRLLDGGETSRHLQGSLDEIAIHARALTEAEIKANMLNTVLAVSYAGKLATRWAIIRK